MVNEPIPEPPTILKATSKPSVAPVLPAISPGSATLGSEAGDPACIDASALSGLDSRELVFKNHVMKRVLCDAYGSCATAGHMVAYKGIGMMMKSYCTIVSCVEDTLEVNSPKLRRGIRIASKTEDLHFTAFAARYETQIEEMAMATAVRVGL